MIEISHLHKYFNKGRSNEIHVIDDVTVSLPEKGIVAIFGRSGCGKTTLLNVIGGLDSYLRGSVMVQGEEVSSHSDTLRNRDMGYIFQNYNLLKNESCFDNVAYALRLAGLSDPEEIKARVDTALSFVDMAQYARRTPDTLSGGQQQRVAIARAIVKNPRIILADEPTGNLDEVNTVKVMDLLREIARDCLVLLVTHEADLVDYYCDTVIELSDGKVVDVRHNTITDGYAVRDKNTVYLGELDRDTVTSDAVSLSYYGAKPSVPIAIKVVNYGGKTYLSVDTPGVQVLDADSEMKLKEGVFVRHEVEAQKEKHVDMSRLPRVQGQRLGRLFTFKNAALSGYRANFGRQKKGKKMLKSCLALFAAVIVFMTAIFGTAIGEIETIRAANNPNVFYVRTDSEATSILLNDPENQKENGIDQVYVRSNYTTRDDTVVFSTGFFETSENSDYNGDFSTHGVFLSASLAEKLPLLAGTKELKEEGDLLLSAATADMLLEKSTVSYLSDYEDLIGLSSLRGYYDMRYRIVGIVDTNESAFYLSPLSLAKLMLGTRYLNIKAASQVGIACEAGSVVYL
ncbi:MAG: ABC transporter ATP-binding protein, partial [Clostridia bacterium]|nr:ABC transporter ATP-binding protein [Clostridia bacterium]